MPDSPTKTVQTLTEAAHANAAACLASVGGSLRLSGIERSLVGALLAGAYIDGRLEALREIETQVSEMKNG